MATNSSDMSETQPSATGASSAPATAFQSEFLSGPDRETTLAGMANFTRQPDHLGYSIPSQPTTSSASAPASNLSVSQGMFYVSTTSGSVADESSSLLPPQASLSVFDPTDDIPSGSVTPAPNIIRNRNLGPENTFSLGPIPPMLVSRILSGAFIELSELLPQNFGSSRQRMSDLDILSWVECFNIYILVMTTFRPYRARDLLEYQALIIRTAKRFGGRAWSQYDRAFRREAEVNNLQDWSVVRTDLYNLHTSAINRRAGPMAL